MRGVVVGGGGFREALLAASPPQPWGGKSPSGDARNSKASSMAASADAPPLVTSGRSGGLDGALWGVWGVTEVFMGLQRLAGWLQ